jgi:penicillin-binding protein 1A
MRKPFIILAKLVLAVLSVTGTGLLIFEGWIIWHYEYGIGLPTETTLAALSPTDHVCATGARGAFVPLADIPLLIRKAVVAYEDPDFYERPLAGSLTEFALAVASNRRPVASNISSSVTRNCLTALSPECCKGIDWHIGSLVFMGRVVRALSQDRILEIYLNDTYFGRSASGVASAAEAYFGKPLAKLDIDEVALMLARARQPNPSRSFDTTLRDFAIDRMLKGGVICEAQALEAKSRPLLLKERSTDVPNRPDDP